MEAEMKTRTLIATTLALGATALAHAGDYRGYDDHGRGRDRDRDRDDRYARVVDVDPIIEHVRYSVPVERCWDEERVSRGGANSAAIVGGVVGAALGSHIGRGADRPASTVAGAVIGAVVGSQVARNDRPAARREIVQRCETTYEERWDERVVGYRVAYQYRGRLDTTRLAYDPGRWVRIEDARRRG
jgi:uncharacterized protein YcfJ